LRSRNSSSRTVKLAPASGKNEEYFRAKGWTGLELICPTGETAANSWADKTVSRTGFS
jgi:hypothetical protein